MENWTGLFEVTAPLRGFQHPRWVQIIWRQNEFLLCLDEVGLLQRTLKHACLHWTWETKVLCVFTFRFWVKSKSMSTSVADIFYDTVLLLHHWSEPSTAAEPFHLRMNPLDQRHCERGVTEEITGLLFHPQPANTGVLFIKYNARVAINRWLWNAGSLFHVCFSSNANTFSKVFTLSLVKWVMSLTWVETPPEKWSADRTTSQWRFDLYHL